MLRAASTCRKAYGGSSLVASTGSPRCRAAHSAALTRISGGSNGGGEQEEEGEEEEGQQLRAGRRSVD